MKHNLTKEEQTVADLWEALRTAESAVDDKVGEVFRKGYQPLLDVGDYEAAAKYIQTMPDGVAKLFARDYLRVSRGDYDKK